MCLLSHISPMERLFVLKTLSRTQRATKVKTFVGFSLKPLRCRDPALPPLYGHAYSRPFFSCTRMRISRVYTRMIHRRGFSTLVLFIHAVVLCESAQRYRALMVILQSHRTQSMILRCYPNVSAILLRHTKSCLLCFFNNPYFPPFNSQNF